MSSTELDCSDKRLTTLQQLPNSLTILWCDNNQLTSLPLLPNSLTYLNCVGNPLIWCSKIQDSKRCGLDPNKVARIHRIICKYLARQLASRVIQRNCRRWIDLPVTKDSKLGIALRIGLKSFCSYEELVPPQ